MFAWLQRLDQHFPVRYSAWLACAVGMMLAAFTWVAFDRGSLFAIGFLALTLLGVRDTRQARHAVLRNYPVIGHLRFLLEYVRPEMRQYFIEGDNEAAPFSRARMTKLIQPNSTPLITNGAVSASTRWKAPLRRTCRAPRRRPDWNWACCPTSALACC